MRWSATNMQKERARADGAHACDALWEAWKILNLIGCHQLPSPHTARSHTLEHHGLEVGSGSIDRSCVACWARAHDDNIFKACRHSHNDHAASCLIACVAMRIYAASDMRS